LLTFYTLQVVFTILLSIWLGYKFFYNTILVTHFWLLMGLKEPLLCDGSGGQVSGENDNRDHIYAQTGTQKNDVHYEISSRSRCTPLGIFLILESRQGNVIGTMNSQNAKNNEHMTAHTVISTILFKWQTTESHYRALASAITQNMKPVA
jgi:hypothetical protein